MRPFHRNRINSNIQKENWGPKTIWNYTAHVQFFLSKITPPYFTVLYMVQNDKCFIPRLDRGLVQLSKYPVVIPLYKAADHRVAEVSNLKQYSSSVVSKPSYSCGITGLNPVIMYTILFKFLEDSYIGMSKGTINLLRRV